jgi:pumilio RNA-binding family
VIQFILEEGRPEDKALVVAQLHGRLLYMARHKFASNVCEKALLHADPESRRLLIDEILAPASKPDAAIVTMMKDQYGSESIQTSSRVAFPNMNVDYVLQRALGVAEGEQKEALINAIRPQLTSMRRYSTAYSKHLTSSTPNLHIDDSALPNRALQSSENSKSSPRRNRPDKACLISVSSALISCMPI